MVFERTGQAAAKGGYSYPTAPLQDKVGGSQLSCAGS
jgi:hypothetical protein